MGVLYAGDCRAVVISIAILSYTITCTRLDVAVNFNSIEYLGIQSATETVPSLEKGVEGFAHGSHPRMTLVCVLLTHLFHTRSLGGSAIALIL